MTKWFVINSILIFNENGAQKKIIRLQFENCRIHTVKITKGAEFNWDK